MNSQKYLNSNACMISVKELLQLMSLAEKTPFEVPLLHNHQRAIANISNQQIDAFIDECKQAGSNIDKADLSGLAVQLRIRRDACNKYAA